MTFEELSMIEDDLLDRGVECPYAPNQPSTKHDMEWDAMYSAFCRERLVKLTLEDWIKVAFYPDLELLHSYIGSYVDKFDLTKLSATDLVILLSEVPDLTDKCDLNTLDAMAWENLIENHGKLFADAKYSIYPEWKKVNIQEALEHYEFMHGE